MTSSRVILLSLPIGILIAGLAMLFPSSAIDPASGFRVEPHHSPAFWYARVMQPGLLFVGAALSLWVTRMYRGDMKRVFFCLAGFLALYGLVNIGYLVEKAQDRLDANFLHALLAYQVLTYAFLLTACGFILRVIGVATLGKWGWLAAAVGLGLAVSFITYYLDSVPMLRDDYGVNTEWVVMNLLIRIFDALVLLALVPVLALYVQKARAKYQESTTFALIGGGIIASLAAVYVYELAKRTSLVSIALVDFQEGSLLDAVYIFGYFVLALGLFAHRKHQEWSFNQVDRILV